MMQNLQKVEQEIAREKGPFGLFGLVLREGADDRWDVVASASWFGTARMDVLRYLSEKLTVGLSPNQRLRVSRVVPMRTRDEFVEAVAKMVGVEHGLRELRDVEIARVQVKRALFMTVDVPAASRRTK